MLVIVVDVATEDETSTEAALRRSGYVKREVWVKNIDASDRHHEGSVVRALGVARYVVLGECGADCAHPVHGPQG